MPRPRSPHAGLTLIELLTALSILAILAALGLPPMRAAVESSALRSATADLLSAIQVARSDAIRLGRRVTICRSQDQKVCDTSTSANWEAGWLVFIDIDRASSTDAEVSATDIVTARHGPVPGRMRIVGNSRLAEFISFSSSGLGRTMGGGMLMGTLRVCSTSPALKDKERAVDLILSASGRVISEVPRSVASTCPAP